MARNMVSLDMVTYPLITVESLIEASEHNGSVVACPNTPWAKLTERYDNARIEDCVRVLTLATYSDYCFEPDVDYMIDAMTWRMFN